MSATTEMLEIPEVSATFFDEAHEDDLNHAEATGVQKSASYAGVFDPITPSTRIQAIRQYCLWCCNGSPKEVRLCPSTNCDLHSLRMGKRSELAPSPKRTIKAKCKDCSEHIGDVRHCDRPDCHLYPYRMGHCPKSTRSNKATKHLGQKIEAR